MDRINGVARKYEEGITKHMLENNKNHFLEPHLNVFWLRPEFALWFAIASEVISRYHIVSPSLDLGCGNGLFSFITAGGKFSAEYDIYKNLSTRGFWKNKDIYNSFVCKKIGRYIIKSPKGKFDFGLDHKRNLLKQADALGGYYETLKKHDANNPLPFRDEELKTVFSNILYWLRDPRLSLSEIHRVLQNGGKAILCMPNITFLQHCVSYRWAEKKSMLLKVLNRGRSENMRCVTSYKDFAASARQAGFRVEDHTDYLSPLTLRVWDIGLRPLSPLLIKMTNKLKIQDRKAIKKEWMQTALSFLEPLCQEDSLSKAEGGFHLFLLRK